VANVSFQAADLSSMAVAAEMGRSLPPAELVVLTTGILAPSERQATAEGIEVDMAVSCLSRLALLRGLLPRLPHGARVFVWGMPGNGASDHRLGDLNAEGPGYAGGIGWVHSNTVLANEALVHHLAAAQRERGEAGAAVFGMNPGLLVTDIRASMHGGRGTWKGRIMEGLLGLFMPSVDTYAARTLPLLLAPGLEQHSGALFNQSCAPILPNKEFEAPGRAAEWFAGLEALLKDKAGL
jgi:hypothetical protein